MIYDTQKASMWKRISAYIFDVILLSIIAVGVAFVLSAVLGYDAHATEREAMREAYEKEYGISFDITQDEYNEMSEEAQKNYDAAYNAFATDPEVNKKDILLINLTLIIASFGILTAYLILELLIPLKLGNGQTLGKKIFGIAVMRVDGVRITPVQLFIRTILGKYTLETMLPVLLIALFIFNFMPLLGLVGIVMIVIIQLGLIAFTRLKTPIHDMISATVAVDMASQLIFDSAEELTEYKKKLHGDTVKNSEYR